MPRLWMDAAVSAYSGILVLLQSRLATVTVLAFMGTWTITWALICLRVKSPILLSLHLPGVITALHEFGLLMAASTMMVMPVIILFFFAQKQFVQGITLANMKVDMDNNELRLRALNFERRNASPWHLLLPAAWMKYSERWMRSSRVIRSLFGHQGKIPTTMRSAGRMSPATYRAWLCIEQPADGHGSIVTDHPLKRRRTSTRLRLPPGISAFP